MSNLGSHKWIFAKTSGIADMAVLKNYVLSTLATKVNGSWVAKTDLTDLLDGAANAANRAQFSNVFGPINNANDFIDKLQINATFEAIFEIF